MQVKNKGMEFEVRKADDSAQRGDCYLTQAGLVWCKGRRTRKHGVRISWDDFITIMETEKSKRAAIKAAKEV